MCGFLRKKFGYVACYPSTAEEAQGPQPELYELPTPEKLTAANRLSLNVSKTYPKRRRRQCAGVVADALRPVLRQGSKQVPVLGEEGADGCFIVKAEIGRAVQQECRDRSRMPSSA
eukprot:TRINITY_DN18271_c0_g1_i2.p1 TRINITY_DN18271_c0_g1~~TRINITY_DN18271_c0_g1_i2.p1  ORF type:complete len:116 (-),score=16.84 TRINITY_DN18271_c0_g1_i2:10-357(-)